ncbi:MAG: phosphate transport system substrate-binding protein [Thermoleophilaceae bacterium]|nr:phosphate transport system substrate-binding protein [Thermoleophilaceae bacterium]
MKPRNWLALAAIVVLALAVAACGSSKKSSSTTASGAPAGKISGAGSTFAAPIYQEVGSRLNSQGITVNYQSIGSGAGVAQFTAGTVDFGASDPPMKPEEIAAAKKKGDPVHVPTAFGAITVSYNLSGVDKGLKLDGATIADMFLGMLKKWNDPAIAKLNSGVQLPGDSITVVHRSDESGTTKGFTDFLQSYSPEWKSKVGSDKTVKWPTGTGAKGHEGVAAAVKQQAGAVGYVEEAYALQNNFTTASVKNKAGSFIEPTLASTTAAGTGVTVPADLRFTVINSPEPNAYPIASQTFVIVWQDACKAGKDKATAQRLQGFLDYMLKDGQSVLGQLQYAKLPDPILQKAQAKVDGLQCNGQALKG